VGKAKPDYLYRIVVRDETGHQKALTADTWEEAKAAKATGVVHKPTDVRAGRQTLRELYDEWHALKSYAPGTRALHESAWKHVAPSLGRVAISKIDSAMVDDVLGKIAKPVMREKTRMLLSTMFAFAVSRKRVQSSPVIPRLRSTTRSERLQRDTADKVDRMPSTEEVGKLVANIPDRYRTLILMMAFEGLRPGEAFGLRVEDLDFGKNTLTVCRSLTNGRAGPTKTGQTRSLPMIPAPGMADALRQHMDRFPSTSGYVFTDDDDAPINSERFRYQVFAPAAKAAGVNDGITPNQLRHHAASYWTGKGANILHVSRLVGHANPTITLSVYAKLFEDWEKDLVKLGQGQALPALPS
jgi:integrase